MTFSDPSEIAIAESSRTMYTLYDIAPNSKVTFRLLSLGSDEADFVDTNGKTAEALFVDEVQGWVTDGFYFKRGDNNDLIRCEWNVAIHSLSLYRPKGEHRRTRWGGGGGGAIP